jgi:hypothetical protein
MYNVQVSALKQETSLWKQKVEELVRVLLPPDSHV